jgi:hypothetical protein
MGRQSALLAMTNRMKVSDLNTLVSMKTPFKIMLFLRAVKGAYISALSSVRLLLRTDGLLSQNEADPERICNLIFWLAIITAMCISFTIRSMSNIAQAFCVHIINIAILLCFFLTLFRSRNLEFRLSRSAGIVSFLYEYLYRLLCSRVFEEDYLSEEWNCLAIRPIYLAGHRRSPTFQDAWCHTFGSFLGLLEWIWLSAAMGNWTLVLYRGFIGRGKVWWTCLQTSNGSILDCWGMIRSSRPL